jgi:3-methyladenine DNA glycosylase AlkC
VTTTTRQDYDPFFDRIDNPEDDNPWVHTEYFSDREETHVPTREECGEIVFQQIRSLMEDGHSQVLTREHAAEIAQYAIKLLS